jgi:hypothetical protein
MGAAVERLNLFFTWARSESNRDGADARVGYSHARSHAGLHARKRPKTRRAAEDLSRAAPDRFGYFSLILRVWSLPFIGHGLRLTLDARDGPTADEVRRPGTVAPRAHVSSGAYAPGGHRGSEHGRHDFYVTDVSAPSRRSQCHLRSVFNSFLSRRRRHREVPRQHSDCARSCALRGLNLPAHARVALPVCIQLVTP